MTAKEHYAAGRLNDAIAAQLQEVKARPSDQGARLFLFELAAFAGDLERARRQVEALNYDSPEQLAAAAGYLKLLESEAKRRRLFTDGLAPKFVGDAPPDHLRQRLDAVLRLRESRPVEAVEVLAEANAKAPAPRGTLNGRAFETLRDADDLFAHVLEVMAHGEYYWVGLEQIALLAMNPPAAPRDLLYVPARIVVEDLAGDVFLPALYPRSHEHPDDAVRLGRATDWKSDDCGPTFGLGQHTYLFDDDAIGLLEWREYQRVED